MNTTIADGKVVTLNYTLKDDAGELIDSSEGAEPLLYLHGAENIVPGLEKALTGKAKGEKLKVTVEARDGYGDRDEGGVHRVSRSQFPPKLKLQRGMQLGAEGPDGEAVPVWVVGVEGDAVVIDFNHPLAGVRLNFDVEVVDIRDASHEEVAHGHPHGPDGHHHH